MSFTKRMFFKLAGLKQIVISKSFQGYLIFTLLSFLCLGYVFNSYNVVAFDSIGMYEEWDEFSSSSSGVDGKHSLKSQGFQFIDFVASTLDLTCPQCNTEEGYARVLENPNISPGAKMGMIGAVDGIVTTLAYNPPYINVPEHLAQEWIPNYAPTTSVYAGGYEQLRDSGITGMWSRVRDIAYLFFIIVFIVAGFMVMFRHKIGGQAMVTLYNTLPNIIVGLVLVTFSFAIVGFIIDFGAMLIGIVDGFLEVEERIDPTSPFNISNVYAGLIFDGVITDLVGEMIADLVNMLDMLLGRTLTGFWELLFSIIIIYVGIKIFFTLIKAYLAILFDTIAGPIVLAIATIPGKQAVMKDWFYRIIKNVLVFVLVFFLLHLPLYFYESVDLNLFLGDLGAGKTAGAPVTAIIRAGAAMYILFLIPNVPTLLGDYFPQTGGKGASGAADGVKKDMSKIPLVGGFFKG